MKDTIKINSLNAKKIVKKKNKFDDALLKLGLSFNEKKEKPKKEEVK